MFLLFSRILECFLFWRNLFVTSNVPWYKGMHEFTTSILSTHAWSLTQLSFFWDAINNFMVGKCSCLLFNFFEQTFLWVLPSRPCSFCSLFTKPLTTNIFFQWSLLLCLLSSTCFICFLKLVFFTKYWKYLLVPGVSYGPWYPPSLTLFAN